MIIGRNVPEGYNLDGEFDGASEVSSCEHEVDEDVTQDESKTQQVKTKKKQDGY